MLKAMVRNENMDDNDNDDNNNEYSDSYDKDNNAVEIKGWIIVLSILNFTAFSSCEEEK